MKALVVEDDQTSQIVLSKMLQKFAEVETAPDGEHALEVVREAWHSEEPFDLICLDIMMPNLDGHGFLEQLRKEEEGRGIGGLDGVKVIMTSALDDKNNILSAFRGGCEAYLTKPIERDKLHQKLRSLGLVIDK